VRSCPNCGASVADNDDFCGNCGTYLGWARPEPPAAQTARPSLDTPAEPTSKPQQPAPKPAAAIQAAPAQPAPERSTLNQSALEQSAPAQSAPELSDAERPAPAQSDAMRSTPVRSTPVQSDPEQSDPERSDLGQPGAVAPARPVVRRPRTGTPQVEPVQGPPCNACGTANPLGSNFCRRCAAPLTEAAAPPPAPWWRRLRGKTCRWCRWFRWPLRSGGGSPWPRRIIALLLLVALVAGFVLLLPLARILVQDVRDKLSTPAQIGPVQVAANAEVAGHPDTAAVDGSTNRYWGTPAPGDWIDFRFGQPFRLLGVIIHTGASTKREDFDQQARPAAMDLVVTASDGTTTTLPISLADQPGPQTTNTAISNVVTIRVIIRSAAGLTPDRHIALGEIEFFKRP
jgi:zinc-ribbon domain